MVEYKVPNALLNNVARAGDRIVSIRLHKHHDDIEQFHLEAAALAKLQESNRILRNHNYRKDTELINLYWHTANQYEISLIKVAAYSGLHIDRYI